MKTSEVRKGDKVVSRRGHVEHRVTEVLYNHDNQATAVEVVSLERKILPIRNIRKIIPEKGR